MKREYVEFSELLGKTVVKFEVTNEWDKDEIKLVTDDGFTYEMYHEQDCCESVYVENICGDMDDLVGHPLLVANEVISDDGEPMSERDDSCTWTFYNLSTIMGSVTIRWYGSSSGCYSESVSVVRVGPEKLGINPTIKE